MTGTVLETLIVEWRADYTKLKQDTQAIKAELAKTKTEAVSSAKGLGDMGSSSMAASGALQGLIGTLSLTAVALKAVRDAAVYTKDAVQLAMDVHESESLFSTSLGNMADDTRAWSEELADALGLNADVIRANVGLWHTMTSSMGLSSDQALAMSKNLVQLKNDLVSYYNTNDERAETIIKGMISGETEPAKQIGVILTEEVAKRALVTAGVIEQGHAVDSTTLMYGRYLAMMEQTSIAQGDMARTLDSPANALRILNAELRETQLAWGEAFLPIAQVVLPLLTAVAKVATFAAQAFGNLTATLTGTKDVVQLGLGVQKNVQDTTTATDIGGSSWADYGNAATKATGAAKQGVEALKASILGFDQLNVMQDQTSTGGGGAGALSPGAIGGGGIGIPDFSIPDIGIPDENAEQPANAITKALELVKVAGAKLDIWLDENPLIRNILYGLGLLSPTFAGVTALKILFDFQKPLIPEYDFLPDGLSESTTSKLGPLMETWWDTETTIRQWAYGNQKVTEDMAALMTATVDGMGLDIKAAIEEQTEDTYNTMQAFFADSSALTEDEEAKILEKIKQSGEDRKLEIDGYTSRINEIYAQASAENRAITDEEKDEILRLMGLIRDGSIEAMTESQTEQERILQHLQLTSSELSARQAADIVKNSKQAKDETVQAAIDQANGVIVEAKRLKDAGIISEEEYDKIVKSAETARDDAIRAAEEQHNRVIEEAKLQSGEHINEVDWETGEVKTRWDKFSEDMAPIWDKIRRGWGDFVDGLKTAWNGFVDGLKQVPANLPFGNSGAFYPASPTHPTTSGRPSGGGVRAFASGGFPERGELFLANEAGPELVGTLGGRTAVANSRQIEAGIEDGSYRGTYNAMMAALGGSNQNEQPINIYIGDERVYSSVQRAAARQSQRSGRTVTV